MFRKESLVSLCLIALLMLSAALLTREALLCYSRAVAPGKSRGNYVVVIDSGHGGIDPGNVASDGTLEKDLNLAIAQKLQIYLEANDVTVIMTREDDNGLYPEDASNKKVVDMKNRVALMEEAKPDLIVSVHQNNYSDSSIRGAQVFYYTTSAKSKQLAELLQESLIKRLDPENTRKAKANDTYYLLKKTSHPIVIAECGFMSNPEDLALLKTDEYQNRVAWALCLGVMEYLNSQ